MTQMHAFPLVGVPATACVPTVTVLMPNIRMNNVFLGWVTWASAKPALPSLGPSMGGILMVTEAPLVPFLTPLVLAADFPAATALVVERV